MDLVTSSDGTPIAFDKLSDGQPVIVVGGQLCDRAVTHPTWGMLSPNSTREKERSFEAAIASIAFPAEISP